MKNLMLLFCVTYILSAFGIVTSQEYASALEEVPVNYKKRSPKAMISLFLLSFSRWASGKGNE